MQILPFATAALLFGTLAAHAVERPAPSEQPTDACPARVVHASTLASAALCPRPLAMTVIPPKQRVPLRT